jgi:hypothetical protein
MVSSDMTMIPGTWEARRKPTAVDQPMTAAAPAPPASRSAAPPEPPPQRRELPGWLQVTIFAVTLLAATWLAMMMFFEKAK